MHADRTDSAIAASLLDALAARRQIPPLTDADPALDLPRAYRIARAASEARAAGGAAIVGRKIGFTNRRIWDEYGVHAPIWGTVHSTTFHPGAKVLALGALIEPRIEPEICLRLAHRPEPGMSAPELIACVGEIAHGFEIVQSLFPGWRFRAADTVAAFGLHGALATGPFVEIVPAAREMWRAQLADFTIALCCNGSHVDEGHAGAVLGGGPLAALAHLVDVLAADPAARPLEPGEVVTTGTLTRAFPVRPGERWTTALAGLPLPGMVLDFV
jgi:2-oxo-3-hexenedioate decarboxylase